MEERLPIPTRVHSLRTTRWSLVRQAAHGGAALDEWVRACWYPLYVYARQKGCPPEDAADAVQDYLGKICTRSLLDQVDPSRGRLRSWLMTGFTNHLASLRIRAQRQKRGGGASHVELDRQGLEIFYQNDMEHATDPVQAYSRAWALTLMDEALTRLKDHYAADGRAVLYEALLPALEAPFSATTYQETASALGLGAAAMRQATVRFRKRYRRMLLDVAGEHLGINCEARLIVELRELLGG